MTKIHRGLGASVAVGLAIAGYASNASAQVFTESWESGSSSWYAIDGNPIVLGSDANICSSTYSRETILYSAGRVFTKAGIPVTGGQPYCLVAWIRGSSGTAPFLGLRLSDASGARGTEHWLIGSSGFGDGYGGSVTAVAADGAWHWYSKAFSVEAGATYVALEDEIWDGGGAGTADFDDIALFAGACPGGPLGAAHVACSAATPVCSAGQCVECTSDASCSGATPRCATATDQCVACLASTDCSGTSPACVNNACAACRSDADCGGATPACQVGGACGQCSVNNVSQCSGATHTCDTPSGSCVGCESNADCAGSTPICNASAHTCGACQSNSDCGGATPACATSGGRQGQCVACLGDSQCSGVASKCDTVSNRCVACLGDGDCSGPTSRCDTTAHACVACVDSSTCSGSTPSCDVSTHACTACAGDYVASSPPAHSCPASQNPACQGSDAGAFAGQCTECSTTDSARCVANTAHPLCQTPKGACGCSADVDCAKGTYCDTAQGTAGACVAGCRGAGAANCPAGEFCASGDGGVGACMGQACQTSADCTGANKVCDTSTAAHGCVACLADSDCSGGTCDPTGHTCVATTVDAGVANGGDAGVATTVDAGVANGGDASVAVGEDASADGSASSVGSVSGSGCGCHTARGSGGASLGGLGAALAMMIAMARRRKR